MTASQSPSAFQADKESPWSSCNKKLIGKCKLWMVLASVFLSFILVIIISLCLTGGKRVLNVPKLMCFKNLCNAYDLNAEIEDVLIATSSLII